MLRPLPLLVALFPLTATAATLDVGPSGTYATINDALAVAQNNDVIEVEAGDYPEVLVIDNLDVDLVALDPTMTTLSGSAALNMVEIVNGSVVTITGFEFVANSPRAIDIVGSDVVLTNVTVTGFDVTTYYAFDDGSGVQCTDGTVEINDSLFDSNTADDGPHVRLEACAAVLNNSTFVNGNAFDDGGVARADSSDLLVIDSTLDGNTAGDDGGVVYFADTGSFDAVGSGFSNNSAGGEGGVVRMTGDGTVAIDSSTLAANTSGGLGGAVRTGDQGFGGTTTLTISSSTLSGNQSTGSLGGAVYHRGDGDLTVTDNVFDNNWADTNGGAIRLFPDGAMTGTIAGNTFVSNTAGDLGGGVAVDSAGLEDAIVELNANTFTGNSAQRGGGASVEGVIEASGVGNTFCGNSTTSSGGGLRLTNVGPSPAWTNNVFIENSSNVGGGLAVFTSPYDTAGGPHAFVNNTFTGNDAADGGNVWISNHSVDFVNNIVANATNGAGMYSDVGVAGALDYNLWFNNAPGDTDGVYLYTGDLGANAVFSDPAFVNYSQDGVCGNDLLTLDAGSPAIDAGDPSIQDNDGSASDIGAFGGPNVPPNALDDLDGDGWPAIADCDDDDATIYPGQVEICDGIDNNCDGLTDDGSAPGAMDWYPDLDGDGFGDDANMISQCYAPPNTISSGGDCDDSNAAINPNASETCDGVDENCDGNIDEGLTDTWYDDADGDGFGDPNTGVDTCDGAPPDTVDNAEDCDDGDYAVFPGNPEVCDGLDNDCSGEADDGLLSTWYRDADADGYGTDDTTTDDCEQPTGFTDEGGDCDDEDPTINPGQDDNTADGTDQDCDGADGKPSAEEKLTPISGCGCSSASTAPASVGWLALIGLLALRRRQ